MLETADFILLAIFLYSIILTKDFFHPAVIVSGVWMSLVIAYHYFDHPYWTLSPKFFYALYLWVVPFVFFAILFSLPCIHKRDIKKDDFQRERYMKLYPYVVFFAILSISMDIYTYGFSLNSIRALINEDIREDHSLLGNISGYFSFFFTVYSFYTLLNYRHLKKGKIAFIFFLLIGVIYYKANKTSIFIFFSGLLYIIYKLNNLTLKNSLTMIMILVLFVFLSTYFRGETDYSKDGAVLGTIFAYTISPLPAFDYLLNSSTLLDRGDPGTGTFTFFYYLFNHFGADYKISQVGEWVRVPLPTNVFTVMRGPYMDWGMSGIFWISVLYGCIWGRLYAIQKRGNNTFVLFYAMMISSLFFQHFGDYFMSTFSVTFIYFLSSIFLTKSHFFYLRRYERNNCYFRG